MTEIRISRVAVALFAVWAFAGCVGVRLKFNRLAENFGLAQRENTTRMIADPAASERDVEASTGLDPVTAEQIMTKYRRTQTQVAQPTGPSIINIGTGPR